MSEETQVKLFCFCLGWIVLGGITSLNTEEITDFALWPLVWLRALIIRVCQLVKQ